MKTNLKYRTFDDLLNEVRVDFSMYSDEGMLRVEQLIKIAQKVNYDLGLRIYSTKNKILEISNGKTKLPDDFYVLNYALVCGQYEICQEIPSGRHTEDVLVEGLECETSCTSDDDPCKIPDPCERCNQVYTNECGQSFEVVERCSQYETHVYKEFAQLSFKRNKFVDSNCFNAYIHSRYNAEIRDGWIYTNIDNGKIFINYEGILEDDEGNLLVLDHPTINEYYEYAIKQRLLENLYLNGEENVIQRLQLVEQRVRSARNNALSIVNTPDFSEMKDLWEMNRKAMYRKYYSMFYSK
jgi:hypothetical protein